jgi:hypothetical protein
MRRETSTFEKDEPPVIAEPPSSPPGGKLVPQNNGINPVLSKILKALPAILPLHTYHALTIHLFSAVPAAAFFRLSMYLIGLMFPEEPWHSFFHWVDVLGLSVISIVFLNNLVREVWIGRGAQQ